MTSSRRNAVVSLILVALLVGAIVAPAAARAQTSQDVAVLTPYTAIAVPPGETASFNLDVVAPEGDEVDLSVQGLPDGWSASITGGGHVVQRVLISENLNQNLKLEIDVPPDAAEGTQQVTVVATSETGTARLDLELEIAQSAAGGVSLETEFPALRGPSDVTFSFSLELKNDTADETQFGLETEGPAGWQIEAKPSGQSRASTVTVAAGGSERISVDADPPDFTSAGTYPVRVRAVGGGTSAEIDLVVEVTGSFAMALVTPDDRLNLDVEAGTATELPLVVRNDGTAPLVDVSLSATPPRGWDIVFAPETIDRIDPGATANVVATVTPSENAIAGDYRITMRSQVAETNDSIELRATVKTSAIWGLVGVAVIVVALGALGFVFRRFGRR